MYWYGIPPLGVPKIPGFKVVVSRRDFLKAKQGEKYFYVDEQPTGYRLFPILPNGWTNHSRALWVPKHGLRPRAVIKKTTGLGCSWVDV